MVPIPAVPLPQWLSEHRESDGRCFGLEAGMSAKPEGHVGLR